MRMPILKANHAIVAVLAKDTQPHAVMGVGFFVSDTHVVTCAHVVADALGISRTCKEKPTAQVPLELGVTTGKKQIVYATPARWYPVDESGANHTVEDIAVLQLDAPPEVKLPPLFSHDYSPNSDVDIFGFGWDKKSKVDWKDGHWLTAKCRGPNRHWVQLDAMNTEAPFLLGYSGGPVFHKHTQEILGMVVARDEQSPHVGWMMAWEVLLQVEEVKRGFVQCRQSSPTTVNQTPHQNASDKPVVSFEQGGQHVIRQTNIDKFYCSAPPVPPADPSTREQPKLWQLERHVKIFKQLVDRDDHIKAIGRERVKNACQCFVVECTKPGNNPYSLSRKLALIDSLIHGGLNGANETRDVSIAYGGHEHDDSFIRVVMTEFMQQFPEKAFGIHGTLDEYSDAQLEENFAKWLGGRDNHDTYIIFVENGSDGVLQQQAAAVVQALQSLNKVLHKASNRLMVILPFYSGAYSWWLQRPKIRRALNAYKDAGDLVLLNPLTDVSLEQIKRFYPELPGQAKSDFKRYYEWDDIVMELEDCFKDKQGVKKKAMVYNDIARNFGQLILDKYKGSARVNDDSQGKER